MPVFLVATNRQLLAVVQARPTSRAALARLSGFGKKKLARFADGLLGVVAAFDRQPEREPEQTPLPTPPDGRTPDGRTKEPTGQGSGD